MKERVYATWSGGIDSTAVVASLLCRGWDVYTTAIDIADALGHLAMSKRERDARLQMLPVLEGIAENHGAEFSHKEDADADWIMAFSDPARPGEIPRRNKRILDYMMAQYVLPDPSGARNLAMGEYVGADTWVVRDHVDEMDADHRSLSAYLLHEYSIDYRLISLQDFGESRFKQQRLRIGIDAGGQYLMAMTTNCLRDGLEHCGSCYKCVERFVAWSLLGEHDTQSYMVDPRKSPTYDTYVAQMTGDVFVAIEYQETE